MGPSIFETLTDEGAPVATVFVLVAQHCVVRKQCPGDSCLSSLAGQTCLLIASTVRDANYGVRGY